MPEVASEPLSENWTLVCLNQPLAPSGAAGTVAIVVAGRTESTLIVAVVWVVSVFPAASTDQ